MFRILSLESSPLSRCSKYHWSFPSTRSLSSQTTAAPLYYEWLLPNNEESDKNEKSPIVFLHGLLGNTRNIRTMATKICQSKQRPGILIDLPGHGKTKEMNRSTHSATFDDTVHDIQKTIQTATQNTIHAKNNSDESNITLIGHSLGGRLALHYTFLQLDPVPDHVWLLDTVPGKVDASVFHVLKSAEKVQQHLMNNPMSRKDLQKVLTEKPYGLNVTTAQWLGSSYNSKTGEFGFDTAIGECFVEGIYKQHLLNVLQTVVNRQTSYVHLIQGGKNKAWEKSGALPALESLQANDYFTKHILPKAGHWVHIEDLQGLLEAIESV